MRARVFDPISRFIGEFAEIHFPRVRGKSEHVDISAGAKNTILCAGKDHRADFRVFKADALERVVEFDVHSEVVGIQLQFVTWPDSAVFGHVHGQRGDRAVEGEAPMFVARRIDLKFERFQNFSQVVHRLVAPRHGSKITLGDDAGHVLFRLRLDPDGVTVGQKKIIGFLFRDYAAADGKYGGPWLLQDALEGPLLDGPVSGLAIQRKNFRERYPRFFFNLVVQFDKRNVGILSEPRSQRRFSRAAQTDQCDALAPQIFVRAKFAREPSYNFFEAMSRNPLEETPDGLFLGLFFHAGREQFSKGNVQAFG